MKPIHRDDVPMEAAEEITKLLKGEFPNCKIVFAGDLPKDQQPEGFKEFMDELNHAETTSLVHGKCWSCEAKMDDYRIEDEDWQPPKGWGLIYDLKDEPIGWECPACNDKPDGIEKIE